MPVVFYHSVIHGLGFLFVKYKVVLTFRYMLCVTIQMKANEQYFQV